MAKTHSRSKRTQPARQRGVLLTVALILVVFHGAIFTALAYSVIHGDDLVTQPAFVGLLFLSSMASAVAGIAMWYWKRWGIYLYVGAGVVTAALFLMRTASMWIFFSAVLPIVIVGYILQPRLKHFN